MATTKTIGIAFCLPPARCERVVGILAAAALAFIACSEPSRADENGISFWLPGQFGSLAAVPQQPGWSMAEVYYHTSVGASGAAAAAREIAIGRFSLAAAAEIAVHVGDTTEGAVRWPCYATGGDAKCAAWGRGITGGDGEVRGVGSRHYGR